METITQLVRSTLGRSGGPASGRTAQESHHTHGHHEGQGQGVDQAQPPENSGKGGQKKTSTNVLVILNVDSKS